MLAVPSSFFSRIAVAIDDRVEETENGLALACVEALGELLLQVTNEGKGSHADLFATRRDGEERAACILRIGLPTHEARDLQATKRAGGRRLCQVEHSGDVAHRAARVLGDV